MMNYRDFEFRVLDLNEEKILYGDDIPKFGEGLVESIRQLSGQSYALSQYTNLKDPKGNKIFEGDLVEIYKMPDYVLPIDRIEELNPIGIGIVRYSLGSPMVYTQSVREIEIIDLYKRDSKFEFIVVGNYLENKELYPLRISEEYYNDSLS